MNRVPRSVNEKGFFHVMVQGINKKYIFEKSIDKEEYLSLLLRYKNNFKILLLAYCIMDNHAHVLIYTDEIDEMSRYMRIVNSKFAREYNKSSERVGYVFRDRFNSEYIDTKDYLLKCLNYIHMNPVKAKMVNNPEEYKYSSYNNFIKKCGNVNNEVIKKIFDNEENYLSILNSISDEEIEIMDVEREYINFMIAVNNYLQDKKISLVDVKIDKEILYDFCSYLVKDKKYKQIQVAELLKVDVKKVYYAIKKQKTKKSLSDKAKNLQK